MKRSFLITIGIILFVSIQYSCNSRKTAPEENMGGDTEEVIDNPSKSIVEEEVQVAALDIPIDTILGKWLRPDGNYILEIKSVDKKGKMEAAYYNPKSIKIALSEAKKEGKIKVFVEFDDAGYEGSVYDLYYDETQDLLIGSYFQATYGQTYQIAFMRYNDPEN